MPTAVAPMTSTHTGTSSTGQPGFTRYMTRRTTPSRNPTPKSRSVELAVESGTSIRGKKTFDTSAWFATSDGAARETVLEKSVHASMLMNEKRKYGTPPEGSWATAPNTRAKMPAVARGWMSTQATPMNVCRYRSTMSRWPKRKATSRASHNSRQGGRANLPGGVMTVGRTPRSYRPVRHAPPPPRPSGACEPVDHGAHGRGALVPTGHGSLRAPRRRRRLRECGGDRTGEIGCRHHPRIRIGGVAEAGDGRRDHGAADRGVFVQLDGVEALGEGRHDVRHDEHLGVLKVADDIVAGARPEEQGPRLAQALRRCVVEGVRSDEDEPPVGAEGARRGLADLEVEAVGVQRADVHGGARREVGGARPGGTVRLDVDRVRDECDRPRAPARFAADELWGARDDGARMAEEPRLVVADACDLGGRPLRRRPVVGDVVERRPPGESRDGGAVGIVDPEERMPHPHRRRSALDSARQPLVGAPIDAAGKRLHRTEPEEPPLEARCRGGIEAPRGPAPRHEVVQGVGGRLDEEHPQRRIALQQARDEVLVASPDVVPRLERDHDEIGHRRDPARAAIAAR